MNDNPAEVTGHITNLAFGGLGILRHEGMVIFVPFTAVGDKVRCRIVEQKKNYARGELLELIEASLDRVKPVCPYFGKCGGCQLQHISYDSQLKHKQEIVKEALNRIGKLPNVEVKPVIPSALQWSYRRHITFNIRSNGKKLETGYIGIDDHTILPVSCCPIFVDPENPVLIQIQEVIKQFDNEQQNDGRVSIWTVSENQFVMSFQLKVQPKNGEVVLANAMKNFGWAGAIMTTPEQTISLGLSSPTCDVEGLTFGFSHDAFLQVNPEQSNNIYRALKEVGRGTQKILDLYCGIGISSILFAKQGASVIGVEGNPTAIKLAKENAERSHVKNIKFKTADVKKVIVGLLKEQKADFVIVNPPRAGLDRSVVEALLANPPKKLVYISCMPSTLARDLALLCEVRYRVVSCQPYDMFPQTGHVETLVCMNNKY